MLLIQVAKVHPPHTNHSKVTAITPVGSVVSTTKEITHSSRHPGVSHLPGPARRFATPGNVNAGSCAGTCETLSLDKLLIIQDISISDGQSLNGSRDHIAIIATALKMCRGRI
ncbi:hypothetical protein L917_07383, partial [Phytophthora nicotianae]